MPTADLMMDPGYGTTASYNPMSSLFIFAIWVLMLVSWIYIFKKAGQEWWKAIIPIYNIIVLLELIKKPWWWILLLFIPLVNFVILILVSVELAKAFGHGVGFALGLMFLGVIFYPILAFDSSKYVYGMETPATPEPQEPMQEGAEG